MVLKRLMAPGYWPIEKKTKKYVVQPRPGPHNARNCIPLGVVVRDILGYARNMREVSDILNGRHVRVDKTVRKEKGFPVGFMDIVSIGEENYRMTMSVKGLSLEKISPAEAGAKMLRVKNKTYTKGKMQINFHDGRNMLSEKSDYKTGDVVVFDLEKNSIKEVIRMEKGVIALITGGSSAGSTGRILEIIVTKSPMPNQVVVDLGDRKIMLPKHYIFVLGGKQSSLEKKIDQERSNVASTRKT